MELIFCGKRDARTVLELYKYCPHFCDFKNVLKKDKDYRLIRGLLINF